MSENSDNDSYQGFGPQGKIPETDMDSRYLIPAAGMLRFVSRDDPKLGKSRQLRMLQQYQWSMEAGGFDWYDVPMVTE